MKQLSVKHTFIKYVSQGIIGTIGLSCYILADTFFIARGIGADGLAALNLAIPIYSFIHGTGLMIGMGGAIRFSISKSKSIFTQAIYYTFFVACFFFILGVVFSNQIAASLGANKDIFQNTSIYLKIILWFSPMFLLNNVLICFVRNDGNPKLSMLAMLVGSFFNIVLDYVFVFPCKMGMFGAALATGIAPIISVMLLSTHFIKKKNTFHFIWQKIRLKAIKDISTLGVSAMIAECSCGLVIMVVNMIILKIAGNLGVAAYGIISNIALVVIAVFTGVSQGMQPIISRCYSTNNKEDVKKALRYGYVTAICFAILIYVATFVFASPIVSVFNKDGDLQLAAIAVNGLRIYFTAFAFVGINILSATYFSAIDCPKKAFLISILRGFIIVIPITFLLSALFGINGVWLSLSVTELIVLFISVGMWQSKHLKFKK